MRRRLDAVVRVRTLIEQQREADTVACSQQLDAAARRRARAEAAVTDVPASGPHPAVELVAARIRSLALHEAAAIERAHEDDARRALDTARERQAQAAVARRCVERVDERLEARIALRAARRAELEMDQIAGDQWRRRT